MNQAEIEQATGLSREVLRKWELRYQFPLPERGARGQRLYQAKDLPKLRLIKQLMAQGLRPGKLVPLTAFSAAPTLPQPVGTGCSRYLRPNCQVCFLTSYCLLTVRIEVPNSQLAQSPEIATIKI